MAVQLDSEESRRRWDGFAQTWSDRTGELGDPMREAVLTPAMLRVIGDVAGKRVLDAGCGEGYLSRLLAKRGASVVAFDYAASMIRIARERTDSGLDITYSEGNAERLDWIADDEFDLIVSNFVLVDLADYVSAIREAFRVLRTDGRFVLSVPHPCFLTPDCGWERDADGRKLHWNVDRYSEEGPRETKLIRSNDSVLIQFHRRLSTYTNTLLRTGFTLEQLVEGKPTEEAIAKNPDWKNDLRMTEVLVFDCRKR